MDNNDDENLWKRIAATVKPLKGKEINPFWEISERDTKPETEDRATEHEMSKSDIRPLDYPHLKTKEQHGISDTNGSDMPSISQDIDRRTQQKLKRGQIPIEARLDLHGFGRADARVAVQNFIKANFTQNKRCLLIITGKGRRSISLPPNSWNENEGVLRRSLPDWLNEDAARKLVLSHCQALPKHGGGGAFYVLLRRKKTLKP